MTRPRSISVRRRARRSTKRFWFSGSPVELLSWSDDDCRTLRSVCAKPPSDRPWIQAIEARVSLSAASARSRSAAMAASRLSCSSRNRRSKSARRAAISPACRASSTVSSAVADAAFAATASALWASVGGAWSGATSPLCANATLDNRGESKGAAPSHIAHPIERCQRRTMGRRPGCFTCFASVACRNRAVYLQV